MVVPVSSMVRGVVARAGLADSLAADGAASAAARVGARRRPVHRGQFSDAPHAAGRPVAARAHVRVSRHWRCPVNGAGCCAWAPSFTSETCLCNFNPSAQLQPTLLPASPDPNPASLWPTADGIASLQYALYALCTHSPLHYVLIYLFDTALV